MSAGPRSAAAFRTVLCATDLSADADEAVRQADALARAHGSKLLVFHALPHAMPSAPLFPGVAGGAAEQFVGLERQVLRILSERVAVLTGRVNDEVELVLGSGGGSAHSAIIEQAERASADLVVVGGAGASGAARKVLGAVAERVVRYAHCPVWVARRGAGDGPVVVGTDYSKSAAPAVELADALARDAGVALKLVHALGIEGMVSPASVPATAPAFPVWTREDVDKLRAAARGRAEALLAQCQVQGTVEINDAKPAEALVAVAEWEKARVICVGTAGHTGIKRIVLGSVAEDVVRRAKCPVLVARPRA